MIGFSQFTGWLRFDFPGFLSKGLLITAGLVFLLMVSCRAPSATVTELAPASDPTAPARSPIPPPLIATVAGPQGQSSFKPFTAAELAVTATSEAQESKEAVAKTGQNDEDPAQLAPPTPLPSPTNTPMPTFTPPALPETPPWEHYWLRRPVPEGGTVWTDKAYPYGSTRDGTLRPHHGVEFYVPTGTDVLAAASGTVIIAGDDSEIKIGATEAFYGNVIVIELDSRLESKPVFNLYGHLSEIFVTQGQSVQAQEVIGRSGASGVADGPHLHFEVRLGENSYEATRNPLLWLYPFPDRGIVAGHVSWPSGLSARNVPITLRRIDAPSAYAATTTYAGNSVNSDDIWNENFAFDDIVAGYYEISAGSGKDKIKQELWVYPYQTSFVEIVLE